MATSVRLETDLERRLDHLAARTGRTKAYYLRELVKMGLGDLEDYYLAAATMERVRKGVEKTYSMEEVRKGVGLDDQVHRNSKQATSQARQAGRSAHTGFPR